MKQTLTNEDWSKTRMAKKLKGDQVFTGQLLIEGDVVFMKADGGWSVDIQEACVATNADEVEQLESLANKGVAENVVIDIYPIVVVRDETDMIVPDHIRERLRTKGPSIAFGPAA